MRNKRATRSLPSPVDNVTPSYHEIVDKEASSENWTIYVERMRQQSAKDNVICQ
jgi:hypothetical protein